uniref:37S ribosomal protein S25, mitochondrial n=1 Tax=Blastobotrys adeninivorans TaxID=409370 RepID=A0A060T978_BLAAD
MRLQHTATAILEKTSRLLKANVSKGKGSFSRQMTAIQEPSWYRVVASHPPSFNLTQKTHNLKEYVDKPKTKIGEFDANTGKYVTRNKRQYNSNSQHLYRVKNIRYFEDKIRTLFYSQHPWELARPKMVVENDGNDASRLESWDSIYQKNKRLDGENVVQRTMYLLNTEQYSKDDWLKAYDQARLEFYRLRMREEAEIQVAAEEAAMFGSVFGKSHIQRGIEREQAEIERWEREAVEATKAKRSRFADTVVNDTSDEEVEVA